MAHPPKLVLLALVAFAPAVVAGPAGAELAKWDQARVTEIAQELAKACDAWWTALRDQPDDEMDEFGLAEKAQGLREQSRSLASHLAKGKGHDETRNLYRSLKEMADDTEVQAQRAMLDEPTLDAWAKVADPLRRIAPYYDPKALDEPSSGAGE